MVEKGPEGKVDRISAREVETPEKPKNSENFQSIRDAFSLVRLFSELQSNTYFVKMRKAFFAAAARRTLIEPLALLRENLTVNFLDKVSNWWHHEVTRPKIPSSTDEDHSKLYQDEIGDPKLNGVAGEYLFQYELNLSPESVVYLAIKQLRFMKLGRTYDAKVHDRQAAVPLPPNKKTFSVEIRTKAGIYKIDLNGDDLDRPVAAVQKVAETLKKEPTMRFSDLTRSNTIKMGRDGTLRVQDKDPSQSGSADIIINFVAPPNGANREKHSEMLLDDCQDTIYSTNGGNALYTITALVDKKSGKTTTVQTKVYHPATDGYPAMIETRKSLQSTVLYDQGIAKKTTDAEKNNSPFTPLSMDTARRWRRLRANQSEKEKITTANFDVTRMYQVANNYYKSIDALNNTLSLPDNVPILLRESKPELPAYQIFILALLLTLDQDSAHQLVSYEKSDSVIPNIVMLPKQVKEYILGTSWKNDTSKSPTANKMRILFLQYLTLSAADRKLIRQGKGILPTLAVMAGKMRSAVQLAGNIVTPDITRLTERQLLISGLTPGKVENIPLKENDHLGPLPSYFTTAVSSTHTLGAIGILASRTATNDNSADRVQYALTIREGKIKIPPDFEEKLNKNLALLLEFIEKVLLGKKNLQE